MLENQHKNMASLKNMSIKFPISKTKIKTKIDIFNDEAPRIALALFPSFKIRVAAIVLQSSFPNCNSLAGYNLLICKIIFNQESPRTKQEAVKVHEA